MLIGLVIGMVENQQTIMLSYYMMVLLPGKVRQKLEQLFRTWNLNSWLVRLLNNKWLVKEIL